MNRVVITGLSFVTSLGLDFQTTWERVLRGESGLGPMTKLQLPDEPAQIAAEVHLPADFSPHRRMGFCERLAWLSLDQLLLQAPPSPDLDSSRIGVFQGAGTVGLPFGEAYLQALLQKRRVPAGDMVQKMPSIVTEQMACRLGATGPISTVMTACSSSLVAVAQAWERIASGELDYAVAGGVEGLCITTYSGFSCLKAVDAQPCRPFSRDRAGLNLGEGSAQVVLEPLERAVQRGAPIWAEVLGYGSSLDAHHPTAPHPDGRGAAMAMNMALGMARLRPEHVDLVSAHGTATPANDPAEMAAIRKALGPAAHRVSVFSCKSQFGHTLGAAGAFNIAMTLLCFKDQVVSPTLRLEDPDPECDLDCTPLHPRKRPLRHALINALAFGGNNACLALKAWEG